MLCLIWQSADAVNATATRHVVVCRHETDDSAASVDTIQLAQTVRGAVPSIATDHGQGLLLQEQMSASVSCSAS